MKHWWLLCVLACVLAACGNRPKALDYGYFRIDLPDAAYQRYAGDLPCTFDLSEYAEIEQRNDGPYWFNINYPQWNATIHCSYKSLIDSELSKAMEDMHTLVYKHTIRADAIVEDYFEDTAHRAYGVFYGIEGDAASTAQFFVTDSVRHFLRGSLYFNVLPNADSIAPVNAFIQNDMRHLMESIEWKK